MGEEEDESTRKQDASIEVKTGENYSRELLRNPRLVLLTVLCVPVLIILVIFSVNLTKTKGLQGLFILFIIKTEFLSLL